MRIDFVQGIITYPISGSQQAFLVKTGSYVSLQTQNGHVDVAFASGDANYLLTESETVTNAWGPIPANTDCWLYWDINMNTAIRTFGFTTIEPVYGTVVPSSPTEGLHWFDTANHVMYAYENGGFRERLRCFAGKVNNSAFAGLGVGFPARPFAGSQVGIYTPNTLVGRIIIDDEGMPIRRQTGEFFTTEDQFFINDTAVTALKLESSVLTGTANETMAKYQIVKFAQFGRLNLATYNDISTTAIGVVLQDLVWDATGIVAIQGVITNPSWNWTTVGAPLWISTGGLLTETDPHVTDPLAYPVGKAPVGRVLTPQSIYFDQGLGGKGDKGDPGDVDDVYATTVRAGVAKLSVSAAAIDNPIVVGDNDPRIVQALLRTGGTMTGTLVLSANPTANLHAATKQYVDSAVGSVDLSSRVAKSGDTMTGLLTLSGDPTNNLHAATKQYVDNSRRAPVEWADYPGVNQPSTGTISLSSAPFNGASNVAVGDSILTVYPNSAADVGVWVVTSINVGANTATVVRRSDTAVGRQMYAGETIFAIKQNRSYVLNLAEVDGFAVQSVTIGTTGHLAYFQTLMEYLTHNDVVGAQQGAGVWFSQMNAVNPLSRTNGMYYISAASGNLSFTLPANANTYRDEDGHSYTFRITIIRTDTSSNLLSFSPPSGQYLDGVLNGTIHIPPGGRTTFMNAQPDQWFVVDGYGARQSVTPYTLTDAATITMNWAHSNNFRLVMNVAGATRQLANPINMADGQVVNIRISQDGTGGRALTYGSKWKWANGTPPTLAAGPNAVNFISAYYDGALDIIIASHLTGLA